MQRLVSQVRTSTPEFAENRRVNEALAAELKDRLAKVALGGPEKARRRHLERGKLLPHERIELLIDPGSAFLELSPLAGWGSDFTVGASVVCGIGVVEGNGGLLRAGLPWQSVHDGKAYAHEPLRLSVCARAG